MNKHAFSRVDATSVGPRPFSGSNPSPDLASLADELAGTLHRLRSLAGVVDPDLSAPAAPLPTRTATALAEDLGAMALGIDGGWRSPESLTQELLQFGRDVRAMKALAAAQGVAL